MRTHARLAMVMIGALVSLASGSSGPSGPSYPAVRTGLTPEHKAALAASIDTGPAQESLMGPSWVEVVAQAPAELMFPPALAAGGRALGCAVSTRGNHVTSIVCDSAVSVRQDGLKLTFSCDGLTAEDCKASWRKIVDAS